MASGDGALTLVLPAVTLGIWAMARTARITRSSMLEVLNQDFLRTARAKGMGEWSVILRHALRNGAIPIVTAIGLELGNLLGGAVITEAVFAYPGVGRLAVEAVVNKDVLKIDVINLSLGHPIFEAAATDPLVQAVEHASRAGLKVVVSTGNFGRNRTTGQIGYAGTASPGNAP